ncbi:hypothetical protein EIJ81_11610 [Aliivibrio salmonicida]|jgi:hypothetical protein|uniref:Membrane protein n=1 Tax=Aliivibrio salmonicida (strain LFI1238) TaxID=316275 RepID=B6EH74_ALISL|nr:hypothetical protein [Aliivibrio salmonicida]AZL85166.1 hypothetical protein EIJ81_11610 [Aliivibrio salmonicida]CAQ79656.1 membrane protein [Aliivibrio salmonicida LFI1238]
MFLFVLNILLSLVLVVVGVLAFGVSGGDLPLLALAIPILWLLPQGGVATWILIAGLSLFGLTLSYQPFPLSISVWTLFPLLIVIFSHRKSIHLIVFVASVVIAMEAGIMALQYEGKLLGSAWATLTQIISVILVWVAARSWKPVNKNAWWPIVLVIPLWIGGLQHAALVALSITGLIVCLQSVGRSKYHSWLSMLSWVLPVLGFATLIISPQFEVPNSIMVSWVMILLIGWVTDFMLQVDEEETPD